MNPFLTFAMKYWSQIALVVALGVGATWMHHKGYAEAQRECAADKAQITLAVAEQQKKTIEVMNASNADTEAKNEDLKKGIITLQDYYVHHPVPGVQYVRGVCSDSGASTYTVPSVSTPPGQPEERPANTVPPTEYVLRSDYDELAGKCAMTTVMLVNARAWAEEQRDLFNAALSNHKP